MGPQNFLRVVFVGNADHGKSTLIGRILLETNSLPEEKIAEIRRIPGELGRDIEPAFITDQLREERELLKTIDTAHAYLRIAKKHVTLIDTPGDTELLKNMITGATAAEVAVIVIDINEGIGEQTARHIHIMKILGIGRIIVVVNKMDLVGYQERIFRSAEGALKRLFDAAGIEPYRILPISAKHGVNISGRSRLLRWHKRATLLEAVGSLRPPRRAVRSALRLPIQDVYQIDGESILVGRVASGVIREKQRVVHLPSSKEAVVGGIRVFGRRHVRSASEGENIGCIVRGIEDRPIQRGDILTDVKSPPEPVDRFAGKIFWISEKPLTIGATLTLRCSTQEVECVIEKIYARADSSSMDAPEENTPALNMNEIGTIVIKTGIPIVVEQYSTIEELGRFVIKGEREIQGVGIIDR